MWTKQFETYDKHVKPSALIPGDCIKFYNCGFLYVFCFNNCTWFVSLFDLE